MARIVDLTKPLKEQDVEDLRYIMDRNLVGAEDQVKIGNYLKSLEDEEADEPAEDPNSEYDYDPGDHTVEEVQKYLEQNPDQADAIVEMERAGKSRKGITGDE
jgi:hypothetical protein